MAEICHTADPFRSPGIDWRRAFWQCGASFSYIYWGAGAVWSGNRRILPPGHPCLSPPAPIRFLSQKAWQRTLCSSPSRLRLPGWRRLRALDACRWHASSADHRLPLEGSLSKTSLHFVQRSSPEAADEVVLPPYSAAADERMGLSTHPADSRRGICFPSSLEGRAHSSKASP